MAQWAATYLTSSCTPVCLILELHRVTVTQIISVPAICSVGEMGEGRTRIAASRGSFVRWRMGDRRPPFISTRSSTRR